MKKFYIKTYGCAMNYADSERFCTILKNLDFKEAKSMKTADLIIFNSCSVRQKAEDRIYGLRPQIEELKKRNPNLKVILTGCMARRRFHFSRIKEIKRHAPWIDLVIETTDFRNIKGKLNFEQPKKFEAEFLNIPRSSKNKIYAGITISHGCDHMCSYCIVPFARGKEICREFGPILQETKEAIASGAKDIMLLGQTVNKWQNPKKSKNFLELLKSIDSLKGDFWLSFLSSHPNYFNKELIDYIAESVKKRRHIRPFIHLALQSGNNEILKRMNRNHKIEEFIQKVEYIKKKIPQVSATTDIIVGFPGETEKQFQDTVNVCKKLKFDQIYISEYSARKGTRAAQLLDNVSSKEKQHRKEIINEILKKTALENNKKLIGTVQKCLILKKKDQNIFEGRTGQNKPIEISIQKTRQMESLKIRKGEFVYAKIKSATSWNLSGIVFA